MQYIRLLLFYSVIFRSVIFQSCKFHPATSSVISESCKFHPPPRFFDSPFSSPANSSHPDRRTDRLTYRQSRSKCRVSLYVSWPKNEHICTTYDLMSPVADVIASSNFLTICSGVWNFWFCLVPVSPYLPLTWIL